METVSREGHQKLRFRRPNATSRNRSGLSLRDGVIEPSTMISQRRNGIPSLQRKDNTMTLTRDDPGLRKVPLCA